MKSIARLLWILTMAAVTVQGQTTTDSRRQSLDELLLMLRPSRTPANGRINAHDRTWEDWLRRTGELPPDFDAMPSVPELPDPLVLREDGRATPVTTRRCGRDKELRSGRAWSTGFSAGCLRRRTTFRPP